MLRDLLVALPGLIGTTGSPSRAEDVGVQASSQIASPAVAVAQAPATTLPSGTASPSFLEKALADFKQQTGYEPGTATEPEDDTAGTGALPLRVDSLTAEAGRVLTIETEGSAEIAGIRVLSQASHGHVSVNPDNSLSLVLSEDAKNTADTAFRYEITYGDGQVQEVEAKVDVTAGQQQNGWGLGQVYMLAEDARGELVVEHGENHRKVHLTEGAHGLTATEIARIEGVKAQDITVDWLIKHPQYGATPDKALDTELGMKLWDKITGWTTNSNWLLFERGYQYDGTTRLITRGTNGESPLNPVFIGAYGEGTDPKITNAVQLYQEDSKHVVLQGVDITSAMVLQGGNLLFDRITVSGEGGLNIQNAAGFTLLDSDITDVTRKSPVSADAIWQPHINRMAGAYIANSDGVLLKDNLFDHNGWGEGYDPNLSSKAPQPPSMYSQNLYLQADNLDVTLRDNITMRGASFGAQVRSGGFVEGNSFIDNNAALNFMGGSYEGAGHVGNYTLLLDNLVTSAGHKRVSHSEGGLSIGVDGGGSTQSAYVGNIVAHLADPNNAKEIAAKSVLHYAFSAGKNVAYDDTIVYNWTKAGDTNPDNATRNVDGLSKGVLDQTTIQNFTAQMLGTKTATIADLANHLRAQAAGKLDHVVDADVINAFFRKGFGLDTTLRADAETLRFVPDDRADGLRWDNRLNWSTGDLPGTQDGDSVDLGGNRVLFGSQTMTVDDFIFGDFGQLKATSGRLDIGGDMATAATGNLIQIDNAGQVWVDGYRDSDLLAIDMAGGRFANTGTFAGETRISVSEDAQLLLATAGGRFDLAAGSSLTITGSKAKIGFDGSDGKAATLQLHEGSALSFVANAGGLGTISEFRSGAFETAQVTSGVRLDGELSVDLSALDSTAGGTWTLVDADQMIGSFDRIDVIGLGASRDALIRYDYTLDEVVLLVSEAGKGSGQIRSTTTGDADFLNYTQDAALKALWADLHAAMPQVTDDPI
ncbi:right-handed parallel beta-helix repeat-containing protein [Paracoccus shandongensis]|uniref:right-handed parallel beta-helix repeat-containing protein n=1 Tax=Paracoccus shandongensis TaxID=2816048 RepID=UPI001A8E1263|nr:right-handed parallel beta-helix repeat-containing protein [Paracoccus shandongensis]